MSTSVKDELTEIRNKVLYRTTRLVKGRQTTHVTVDGCEKVLMLSSNNYLGLADHPALSHAAITATEKYGTSSAASRLVSGTMELHEMLEKAVANFKETEAALIFNSGYSANTGIIPALAGRGDTIFSDSLNHASIVDGIMLSKANLVRYPHNDHKSLERLLENDRGHGRCLIITDGVFSMDGDIAPLRALVELKKTHNAILMVDDAHGTGVLGNNGRGSAELLDVEGDIDIQMGTFGKALGSFGAYAAVSQEIRELLINRARSFIFSTSLPPSVLAASAAAIELVKSPEGRKLREQLLANTAFFKGLLEKAGFSTGSASTQIVPIMSGDADTTMRFSGKLLEEGIFLQGIRPPTVPAGECRLRCTMMATHCREDLSCAVDKITTVARNFSVI